MAYEIVRVPFDRQYSAISIKLCNLYSDIAQEGKREVCFHLPIKIYLRYNDIICSQRCYNYNDTAVVKNP